MSCLESTDDGMRPMTGGLDNGVTRPPKPADLRMPPVPGVVDRLRETCVAIAHHAADRRWLGVKPARGVVICGFPRSGTTLLQLMLETAYPSSRHFGHERSGLLTARRAWPGKHSLIITKRPNDVFWIDEIRQAYRARASRPCFIVTMRDPRAVLTSKHVSRSDYYVSVERWRSIFDHMRYVRHASDVVVVEYGDLVRRPHDVQERLVRAIGEDPDVPFDAFAEAVPAGFRTRALNGVRPLDASSLEKWRQPEHRERLREVLATMPELPSVLVEEGYESSETWTSDYQ
jgi:hypothetical protein